MLIIKYILYTEKANFYHPTSHSKEYWMKFTDSIPINQTPEIFQKRLEQIKALRHSNSIFNTRPPIPDLEFMFDKHGVLSGKFTGNNEHQGYDTMVHGGLLAAVVDASMTQCLMGHGITAYTTDLSLKYRKPVKINKTAFLETRIEKVNAGRLYTLSCSIFQDKIESVNASGRFYRIK